MASKRTAREGQRLDSSKTKRKRGRPPLHLSPALRARICRGVALGNSLRKVLKGKGMPSMSKLMETLAGDSVFAQQYARARKQGIELHIDGLVDLADTADADNAHAVRLKVDVRKWIASKLVPKVYGERVEDDENLTRMQELYSDEPLSQLSWEQKLVWVRLQAFMLSGLGRKLKEGGYIQLWRAVDMLGLQIFKAIATPSQDAPAPRLLPARVEREVEPMPDPEPDPEA